MFKKLLRHFNRDWGCTQLVDQLLNMLEALGLVPNTPETKCGDIYL